MTVQIIEDFISPKTAAEIVANYLDIQPEDSGLPDDPEMHAEPVWIWKSWGRHPDELEEDYPFINLEGQLRGRDTISTAVLAVRKNLETFYNKTFTAFETGLCRLDRGASNGLHSDMYELDGSLYDDDPPGHNVLEYSALLYLGNNGEDFVGGEIYFPEHDLEISQKAGMLVFFRGDLEHTHGVNRVVSGHRYALVFFFG